MDKVKIVNERFPENINVIGYKRDLSTREPGMRKAILEVLKEGPKTIPEVAKALGIKTNEAMWWMMGYNRYGYIAPTGEENDDGYFEYKLTEKKGER